MLNSKHPILTLELRQRLIKRWSAMHSVQVESALDHSYFVTFISYLVGNIAIQHGKKVDLGIVLAHSSLHDFAELEAAEIQNSTDISGSEKTQNSVLQIILAQIQSSAEFELIDDFPEEIFQSIDNSYKPGSYEQKLVIACDTYASYIKQKLDLPLSSKSPIFGDISGTESVIELIKKRYPEICSMDKLIGARLSNKPAICEVL